MSRMALQWRSIKTPVTLFTLAVFLLSLWALALYASRVLREDIESLLGEQQFSMATILAEDVDSELANRLKHLETVAASISPSVPGHPEAVQNRLDSLPIFQYQFNGGAFVTTVDGAVIAEAPLATGHGERNLRDSEAVAAALDTGKPVIGPPIQNEQLRAPVFHMATPIRDAQGRVRGALVGVTHLAESNFLDRITENRFGKSGGYLLVSPPHRRVVTATDKRRIMESSPPRGAYPAIDRFLDGAEGTEVFVNPLGVEVLQSVKRVPSAGWYVAVTLPTEEAFAPIRNMQQRMMFAALLLSLLAGAATWWLLRRQLSPMLETVQTLASLAEQPESHATRALPITRDDEIGQLIGAFNRLLETLAQRAQALRESTERLNEAQRISRVGSWELDLSSGRLSWSDQIYRLFEMDPNQFEATYAVFLSAIHPEDREMVDRAYKESLKNRTPYEIVHRLQFADGRIKWVRERCSSEFDVDGRPLRSIGTVQDITDPKNTADALREAKTQLESVVGSMPAMVFLKNADDLRFELFNRAGEELLGYKAADLCGKNDYDFFPKEQADAFNARDREVLASQDVIEIPEEKITTATGATRYLYTRKSALRDASGRPTHLLGISLDITERKHAESELRIAAAAFESLEGMIITDAHGVIQRVNRAFTEITGYAAEEVVGKTPRLLRSGRHGIDFYRAMWHTIGATGGWQGEIWDRHKDGHTYPTWLTISAVKDEKGQVTHYIGAQYDITDRKQSEERINQLAFYDQLTTLPNRTLLLDRLKQALMTCSRSGHFGALLFIDLDKFKTLNDTLGHDKGDMLLQHVARRLTTCVRAGDTVARLGGDEFVVMLVSLSTTGEAAVVQTETVGEKILAELDQPYLLDGVVYHSTASIGATLFSADRVEIETLLKQADLAMYKAKAAGRNAMRFFDPHMETDVVNRAALENDLHEAIEKNQFQLHYQAQMSGGVLSGSEALVRWMHPRRGMVSPAEFIPLAEETGMILPLGEWILETACRQLAHWATRPALAHLTIAVNVSARQFRKEDFVERVTEILQKTGANPRRLKLELTESLLVEDVEGVIEKMKSLKMHGVGFALDDFGTGYSSLYYLKRLPLEQMKIDRSFVRDILDDPNDAAIARTIVALAQGLGLGVIAEGVETEEQLDFLAELQCHAYQGYYFSQPLPADGFEDYALNG